MAELLKPDICVIGGGSGGLSVAAAAAAFGVPVVLIEKSKMGGDCLNTGCVPSKALIAAAAHAHALRHGEGLGVAATGMSIDFGRVREHVRQVIAAIAPNDSRERFAGLGVRVVEGAAAFVDSKTVVVNDVTIKARRFVIATGSSPAIPRIDGLESVSYLTNETIFELGECPQHLIVIGAGPVGLELGQAFRRLGAAVTVLDASSALKNEDPECAAAVLDQLARDGVSVRTGIVIARVARGDAGISVVVKGEDGGETITGTHLLIATGREPSIKGLGLDLARVRHAPHGIVVNKRLRTSNRRVYAVGDVAGRGQFTHLANYHAGLVVRNALFRIRAGADETLVPRVTFTDPELAHVGLTETQVKDRHARYRILRRPFHDNDRAQTERATQGHVKILTTKGGRLLGATIVGAGAGELIAPWALALAHGMGVRDMASLTMPYPTRGELAKRATIDFFTPSLTSPLLRRIIRFLRIFG